MPCDVWIGAGRGARGFWLRDADKKRLVLGKSYYGYAPLGPWMVTADEVPNPQEVGLGNDRFAGTADLLLRFLPSPRVIFHASAQGAAESALRFVFNDPVDPSLSFNGQRVEGFCGKRKANADTLELDWHPQFEPVV